MPAGGLRLDTVAKRYPDFSLALSLEAEPGELMALLGPSGCGKTTTLRLVAGFLAPDSGSILIDGRRMNDVPTHRRGVGIVFQDYALFPNMRVARNISFGPRMQGWTASEAGRRVDELLELVMLQGYGNRRVDDLSGGERQRVALARALAPRPQLLLLDEPLSALDRGLRDTLRRDIRRIQQELGVTTVYVTHDQVEALALADRVAVMNAGRLEQVDHPRAVYLKPATGFVARFMGHVNAVTGTVVGRSGRVVEIRSPLGVVRAEAAPDLTVGSRATAFFRPEALRRASSQAPPADVTRIPSVVQDVEYIGEATLVRVRVAGTVLTARLADTPPAEPGRPLALDLAAAAGWAVADVPQEPDVVDGPCPILDQ